MGFDPNSPADPYISVELPTDKASKSNKRRAPEPHDPSVVRVELDDGRIIDLHDSPQMREYDSQWASVGGKRLLPERQRGPATGFRRDDQ
jgi:hypothetical protein